MAAKHNFYLGPFCPKNTISCGAAGSQSPYIGLFENAFLSRLTYGHGPPKATYDLMSRAWNAAVPMRKVVRLKATKTHSDCTSCAQGMGWTYTLCQERKW
jgi:hypothetical protein